MTGATAGVAWTFLISNQSTDNIITNPPLTLTQGPVRAKGAIARPETSCHAVTARLSKHSTTYTGREIAVVSNIYDTDGKLLTDHAFVQFADNFKAYSFCRNEQIQFMALVTEYTKKGGTMNYGLSDPTAIKSLERHIAMPSLTVQEQPAKKSHS